METRPAIVLMCAIVVAAGCRDAPSTSRPSEAPKTSSNAGVEYLLASAVADFRANAPHAARVRSVRTGYLVAPDGTRRYRLCGEFQPSDGGDKVEWTPFATIQTSGYEQYLGAQAKGFCDPASLTWEDGDLSSALQSRLDAAR